VNAKEFTNSRQGGRQATSSSITQTSTFSHFKTVKLRLLRFDQLQNKYRLQPKAKSYHVETQACANYFIICSLFYRKIRFYSCVW